VKFLTWRKLKGSLRLYELISGLENIQYTRSCMIGAHEYVIRKCYECHSGHAEVSDLIKYDNVFLPNTDGRKFCGRTQSEYTNCFEMRVYVNTLSQVLP
jgi:hypothetical protein